MFVVNNPEPYLITMAETALKLINEAVVDEDGSNTAMELKSCKSKLMNHLYKNLLNIGRYNDARMAIMENPDSDM